MEAADEIGLAVVATTFTLMAVFLPTAFMSGVAGKFFKQFGWTASLAVFASLVVARVLTPMMAAYILKPVVGTHTDPAWMKWYMRAATWCMKHRVDHGHGHAVLLRLGGAGAAVAHGFHPARRQLADPGLPGAAARRHAGADQGLGRAGARQLIGKVEHVKNVYTTIGGGTAGGDPFAMQGAAETRKATLTVLLDRAQRAPAQAGHREQDARRAGIPARRAQQGRPGRLGRSLRAGADG
jgi:multidrug efflux pump subunit AcrB